MPIDTPTAQTTPVTIKTSELMLDYLFACLSEMDRPTATDADALHRREEARSFAIEFVTVLRQWNPELVQMAADTHARAIASLRLDD